MVFLQLRVVQLRHQLHQNLWFLNQLLHNQHQGMRPHHQLLHLHNKHHLHLVPAIAAHKISLLKMQQQYKYYINSYLEVSSFLITVLVYWMYWDWYLKMIINSLIIIFGKFDSICWVTISKHFYTGCFYILNFFFQLFKLEVHQQLTCSSFHLCSTRISWLWRRQLVVKVLHQIWWTYKEQLIYKGSTC